MQRHGSLKLRLVSSALLATLLTPPQLARADEAPAPSPTPGVVQDPSLQTATDPSPYRLRARADDERNAFFPPLISFMLPGWDQWWEGQIPHAPIYSGLALGGLTLSQVSYSLAQDPYRPEDENLLPAWGAQLYTVAGGLSLYHSFRTAALSQKRKSGGYAFLEEEETPGDIATAPFEFSHLGSLTTIIPMAVVTAWLVVDLSDHRGRTSFTGSDAFYSLAFSYNAGTWEEAAFRGWMMPVAREWTGSDFASNLITATIFGAAHFGNGYVPWPQAVLGFYLGWVSQQNRWTLSESIFIHTWWDVVAFAGSFATSRIGAGEEGGKPATLWLPIYQARF